jgi:hypothetical protein
MPRKPKPPPIPELHIEGLSTGEVLRDRIAYDELDGGKPFLLPEHYGPYKPPADLHKLKTERKQRVVDDKRLLLQAVGILPGLVRPKPEPKLAHNQLKTESGLVITVKRGANSLKRRF